MLKSKQNKFVSVTERQTDRKWDEACSATLGYETWKYANISLFSAMYRQNCTLVYLQRYRPTMCVKINVLRAKINHFVMLTGSVFIRSHGDQCYRSWEKGKLCSQHSRILHCISYWNKVSAIGNINFNTGGGLIPVVGSTILSVSKFAHSVLKFCSS